LDPRWLRGGWTSHFHWDLGEAAAYYYSAQVNWPFTQSRDIVQEQS